MLILIRSLAFATVKGIGALALGGVVLWQVAEHSGPQKCVAYVHVSVAKVEVKVDDVAYEVESLWETPIVCELGPGRHILRMSRSERLLYEQEFTLGPGQEIVLIAWEQLGGSQPRATSPSLSLNDSQFPSRPARRRP
jgi:hypothetical protein